MLKNYDEFKCGIQNQRVSNFIEGHDVLKEI